MFTVTCKRRGSVQSILHRRKSARFSLSLSLSLSHIHARARTSFLYMCTRLDFCDALNPCLTAQKCTVSLRPDAMTSFFFISSYIIALNREKIICQRRADSKEVLKVRGKNFENLDELQHPVDVSRFFLKRKRQQEFFSPVDHFADISNGVVVEILNLYLTMIYEHFSIYNWQQP